MNKWVSGGLNSFSVLWLNVLLSVHLFKCMCVIAPQVLCTAVTEQNLLKTVTQIFADAEALRLSNANGNNKRMSPHYSYTQSAGMMTSQNFLYHYFATAEVSIIFRKWGFFNLVLMQIPVCMMRSCRLSCTQATFTSQAPSTKGHYLAEPETVGECAKHKPIGRVQGAECTSSDKNAF